MVDMEDPYGLRNRGPQRPNISQSWDMLKVGAPVQQSAAPVAQAPTRLTQDDRRVLQRQVDLASLGVTPEAQQYAGALSRQTGQEVSPLLVQSHMQYRPGQAARAAGYVPTGRSTQTTGTMVESAIEEMRDRGTSRVALTDTAAREKAAADSAALRLQEDEALAQANTSREEYDAWESKLTGQQKKLMSDMQDIASERVDPGRLFAERGAIGSALSAIADAGSYYASAMLGRPFASQLQADIDRDVALQSDELERKKGQATTELAILRDEFGDPKQAKAALRAKQETYAIARLSRLAREQNEPAVQAALDADLAAMQESLGNTLTELQYGRQSTASQERYQEAQAGTRGGYAVDMPGVMADLQKGLPKEDRADMAALGAARAPADQVVATIDQLAAENGLVMDPKTLQLTSPDGVGGFGFMDSRTPQGLLTEEAKATRAKTTALVMAQVQQAFGAANPDQVRMLREQMLGSETEEDFRVAINEALRQAKGTISTTNAGRPAAVVSAYEQRLREEMARSRQQTVARAEAQQKSVQAEREAGLKAQAVTEAAKPRLSVPEPSPRTSSGYGGILTYRGGR